MEAPSSRAVLRPKHNSAARVQNAKAVARIASGPPLYFPEIPYNTLSLLAFDTHSPLA
jgi:hypothetical protein